MLSTQKNSRKQGDVGMGLAIGWFTTQGYTVSIPLTDSQDYDLIFDDGIKLNKVQIRTTYFKDKEKRHDFYKVNLKVCGGNRSGSGKTKHFDKNKVDYLFVVTEEATKYLISSKSIETKTSLTLNKNLDKYIVN